MRRTHLLPARVMYALNYSIKDILNIFFILKILFIFSLLRSSRNRVQITLAEMDDKMGQRVDESG